MGLFCKWRTDTSQGCAAVPGRNRAMVSRSGRSILFYIKKKNQNFKNICLFWKISKIYPGRPRGATGPKCNFFFKSAMRSLAGGARVQGGPVAPSGDRVSPPYISILPLFPPHLSPKISPKIQKKKRGIRRREAAKPCRIAHLWSAGNYI